MVWNLFGVNGVLVKVEIRELAKLFFGLVRSKRSGLRFLFRRVVSDDKHLVIVRGLAVRLYPVLFWNIRFVTPERMDEAKNKVYADLTLRMSLSPKENNLT